MKQIIKSPWFLIGVIATCWVVDTLEGKKRKSIGEKLGWSSK